MQRFAFRLCHYLNSFMKIYLAAFTVLIFIALSSNAQKLSWEYGLQTGINLNSAYGTAINKDFNGPLLGLSIGGHIKMNSSPHFGIKVIVQYDQNGYAYRGLTFMNIPENRLVKGDVITRVNYINLPVIAEYAFGNKIKFTAGAGMFFGILLGKQLIIKIKDMPASTTKSKPDYIRSANFGITACAGLQFPLGKKLKLNIDFRDNYGFANINKSTSSAYNTSIKTNALSLLFGLSLLM